MCLCHIIIGFVWHIYDVNVCRIWLSIYQLTNNIDADSTRSVFLGLELYKSLHNGFVGQAEDLLDLVDAEGAPRCVIRAVLEVTNVDVLTLVPLLG